MSTLQSLNSLEKNLVQSIGTFNREAMAAANAGRFKEAETKLMVALAGARSLEKGALNACILNSIGIVYAMQGIWDNALLFYDRALALAAKEPGRNHYLYKTIQKNILGLLESGRETVQ